MSKSSKLLTSESGVLKNQTRAFCPIFSYDISIVYSLEEKTFPLKSATADTYKLAGYFKVCHNLP